MRVLDLSRLLPGPYATHVLSDLGARVDKLEDTAAGDYLRGIPPLVDGVNATFRAINAGKRSVALDLKDAAGVAALRELVTHYDVLVESFRPGVMERLGVGYEALSASNPGLVYCAISGYGADGPLSMRAGHDINYLARAGVLGLTGPSAGPPALPGAQMADMAGGALYAAIGIIAALLARASTGLGRKIDVSMTEGVMALALNGISSSLAGVDEREGRGVLAGGIAPYRTYATKDGRAMALGALEPKFWSTFCDGVGLTPDMAALAPGDHQTEWIAKLTRLFGERTRAEWIAFAEAHDCCLAPVLYPAELVIDEQHVARQVFSSESPPLPRSPFADRTASTRAAPAQGEHTVEILREAGFDPDRIDALVTAAAARRP